jgi:uncharacterized membrane protein
MPVTLFTSLVFAGSLLAGLPGALTGLIGFAIERDRLYVAVSLTILAVLMFSIFH